MLNYMKAPFQVLSIHSSEKHNYIPLKNGTKH